MLVKPEPYDFERTLIAMLKVHGFLGRRGGSR
ncbi:hypothetical protein LCGC14_0510250 [marine sediment metagenome]|uniref:Uncharacterized protein n=1 Tax=marine sediment metagenome TaxID=412755 RepID=A0A0F9S686_9ZZZZ